MKRFNFYLVKPMKIVFKKKPIKNKPGDFEENSPETQMISSAKEGNDPLSDEDIRDLFDYKTFPQSIYSGM